MEEVDFGVLAKQRYKKLQTIYNDLINKYKFIKITYKFKYN